MKFTPEVIAALATLRDNAENDFERHRIDVLERDLTAPPQVEVIDDKHQLFNGIIYASRQQGHYFINQAIHQAVWRYCVGEPPVGYDIHHVDENKSNNTIENLQCIPHAEHMKIHKHCLVAKERVCIICGKPFFSKGDKKFCSQTCWLKSKGTVNTCPVCGKEFLAYIEGQQYCSHKCARTAQKQKEISTERICLNCGKTFSGRIGKFCSNKCYQRFIYRNNTVEIVCEVCGKTFNAYKYNKHPKTCSHSCASKLARHKKEE